MEEASQVTLIVADMTAGCALKIPVQVARMDYYGRELEIWADAGDASKLKLTVDGMRHEEDAVRRSVEARAPPEAKKFGALVARVERARTPAEYGRLAERAGGGGHLEKVFER
jgi:hypothetical protein